MSGRLSGGAPPSAAAMRSAVNTIAEKRNSINAIDAEEYSGEESDELKNAADLDDEIKAVDKLTTSNGEKKRKRRKRRIRLTDQGLKAKRKAERREKLLAEKKNEVPTQDDIVPENKESTSASVEKEIVTTPPQQEQQPTISPAAYTPFQLFCDNILRKIILKDPEEYFLNPVTTAEAPDYDKVVETPMDFTTISRKIQNNVYQHVDEFRHDVELISDNALLYNSPGNVFHIAAQKLALLNKYYFSEKYLTYLFYSLPFARILPIEMLGINLRTSHKEKTRQMRRERGREKVMLAISDTLDVKDVLDDAPKALKNRLATRTPDNCHIAYLDNRDGAIALNILTPADISNTGGNQETQLRLGDLVKPLDKGNPGVCTRFEPKINQDFLVTYTNPGPYASFAPQYDSTWATLSKRDSDLLLSCYGDEKNVADAFSLRQMVEDAGEYAIGFVDGMLNELTGGEHSRTLSELKGEELKMNSLPENEGLQKTGKMLEDLATMQYKRLSMPVPNTLGQVLVPENEETQLAKEVVQQLGKQITELNAAPQDVVTLQSVHQALGLDADDFQVLSEFLEV